MELNLTRRRFCQLAIAGTVVAVLGTSQRKVFSQISTLQLVVIGVRSGPIPSPDLDTGLDDPMPDTDEISTVSSATVELILESLDIPDTQPKLLPIPQIVLESDDQVTGFTSLFDGTFVAAVTPLPTRKERGGTRLIVGPSATIVTISGLRKNEQLGSLVGTKNGGLLGLVVRKNGKPPVRLVEVDWRTGNLASKLTLPGKQRFSNLAECPDGKLYTTGTDKDGKTSLLLLDLQTGNLDFIAELKVNDVIWDNGLDSLVCSPANQLFAFGALRYQYPKALYSIDESSGDMLKLQDFDVTRITVVPS